MEFNPSNNVIKLCVQGMDIEGKANAEEASRLFLRAWNEATNDFEKYILLLILSPGIRIMSPTN
jgi:hypothetical protein